jgi:hypothetical protein
MNAKENKTGKGLCKVQIHPEPYVSDLESSVLAQWSRNHLKPTNFVINSFQATLLKVSRAEPNLIPVTDFTNQFESHPKDRN